MLRVVLLASFEDITELDADMGRWGHFTRDQTIAPGNRAQKRHYTTAGSRRVGMRARTQVAGSQDTHTDARERELLWHQYTGRCRVFRLSERVCVYWGTIICTHGRATRGPSLPSGGWPAHTTTTTTGENDSSTLLPPQKHYTTKISDEIT